ncbi:hypothetical protein H4Q26_012652, partial [Puccinia striiformis f. sp. tritici PST-130]
MTPKRFIQVFLGSAILRLPTCVGFGAIPKGLPPRWRSPAGFGIKSSRLMERILSKWVLPQFDNTQGRSLEDHELDMQDKALTTVICPSCTHILATLMHWPHAPAQDKPAEASGEGDGDRDASKAFVNGLDEDDPSTLPEEMGGVSYVYLLVPANRIIGYVV